MNKWNWAKQREKAQENEHYGEDPKGKSKRGGVKIFFHVFSNNFYNLENDIFKKYM